MIKEAVEKMFEGTKVANKQNPVGVNNPNKDIYFKQADEYLEKQNNKVVYCK